MSLENGVPSRLGPHGCLLDRPRGFLPIVLVEEVRLDALGIIRRRNRRCVGKRSGQRNPNGVCWLRLDLGEHSRQVFLRPIDPFSIFLFGFGVNHGSGCFGRGRLLFLWRLLILRSTVSPPTALFVLLSVVLSVLLSVMLPVVLTLGSAGTVLPRTILPLAISVSVGMTAFGPTVPITAMPTIMVVCRWLLT